MREQFLNDPEDVQWLKDVHVGETKFVFESFIIYGNEDCPDKVELFLKSEPAVDDKPVAVIVFNQE